MIILLTNGGQTVVSEDDYDYLSQYNWQRWEDVKSHTNYATRCSQIDGRRINVYMHREVAIRMGFAIKNLEVDHRNRDGLDNQRSNLRVVTHSVNMQNQKLSVVNTSGVKGVTWYPQLYKWRAQIQLKGTCLALGYFTEFDDAVNARLAAEKRFFQSI